MTLLCNEINVLYVVPGENNDEMTGSPCPDNELVHLNKINFNNSLLIWRFESILLLEPLGTCVGTILPNNL